MSLGPIVALSLRLAAAGPQDAGSPGVGELDWRAPPGCPSQGQMAQRIANAGGSGRLRVQGTVTQLSTTAWRLALVLDLDGKQDRRVLHGNDCAALADAAELLIAVELDSTAGTTLPDPPATGEPAPPPEQRPARPTDDAPPSNGEGAPRAVVLAPAPRRPVRSIVAPLPTGVHVGLAGGVSIGAMPLPGLPLEVGVGWSAPRFRLAIRGRYFLPRRRDLGEGRAALVQLGTAGGEGCARPHTRRVEFPVCAQVSVGGSHSAGRGPGTQDRRGVWAEAGAELGVAWSVTARWAITARLGAAAVLAGTRYVLRDVVVFDPAPVNGRLVLGVETLVPIQFGGRPEKQ